ncbi:MAG: hypothetical protein R3D00_12155 [Bacteroidia bacterium]
MKPITFSWNRTVIWLLLLIAFLPLFFINLTGYHGWGDDFAQYIHQAKNVTVGISPSETGHILNEEGIIGPAAYPMGFPLLLAPLYALFGNNMLAFQYYMTFLLCLLGLGVYYFLSRSFSVFFTLAGVLWLIYHPWVLHFKAEVLSEIPYTWFLVVATAFWMYGKGQYKTVGTGLLAGFAILIRPMGIVLVGAVMLETAIIGTRVLLQKPGKNLWETTFSNAGITTVIALCLYFIVEKMIFPSPSEGSYVDLILAHSPVDYCMTNLKQYGISLGEFVFPAGKNVFSIVLASMAGLLFLGGLILKLRTFPLPFLIVLVHIAMLGIYPYFQGARFLFPVLPMFLFYILAGIEWFAGKTGIKKYMGPVVFTVLLLFDIPDVVSVYQKTFRPIISGPQQEVATEVFSFIGKELPGDVRILFHKPRALALYAGKTSMFPGYMPPEIMWDFFMQKNMSHFLINDWMETQAERDFFEENGCHLTLIFRNDRYRLYSIDYAPKEVFSPPAE